jgi:hypothetical protein
LARRSPARRAAEEALQTSRSQLPSPAAPGVASLGLRFAKDLKRSLRKAGTWIPVLDFLKHSSLNAAVDAAAMLNKVHHATNDLQSESVFRRQ